VALRRRLMRPGRAEPSDRAQARSALGHEERFPPTRLSAGYVIREKTFAGTHGNGRDAPIPAIRGIGRARRL
jgi:hypothetical protein